MKFSTREDIDSPITDVFNYLMDFGRFERAAIDRGVKVTRTDALAQYGVGCSWDLDFTLRGKRREIALEVVELEAPEIIRLEAKSASMESYSMIELLELSPKRTRMDVSFEIKPTTLGMRLMLQSLKIARSNLNKRYKLRVAEFAHVMETNIHQGSAQT